MGVICKEYIFHTVKWATETVTYSIHINMSRVNNKIEYRSQNLEKTKLDTNIDNKYEHVVKHNNTNERTMNWTSDVHA